MPECQKIKNSGLGQYDAERFGRFILVIVRKSVGPERVNVYTQSKASAFNIAWTSVGRCNDLCSAKYSATAYNCDADHSSGVGMVSRRVVRSTSIPL